MPVSSYKSQSVPLHIADGEARFSWAFASSRSVCADSLQDLKKWFLFASAFIFAGAFSAMDCNASAATYYVATTGSDSSTGSQTSPFASLQKAANVANAGDTIIVADGVYTSASTELVSMSKAGAANGWITFQSQHPRGAKLSGKNNATTYMIWFSQNHGGFVRIKDFEIYGFSKLAINTTDSHDIDIVGNDIHDIGRFCNNSDLGAVAVYGRNSPNVKVEVNTIHDIGRFGPGENGCNPANGYWQNHDHGVYVDGMNNASILSNNFYNMTRGWPIQVYSGTGLAVNNLVVSGNIFVGANPNRDGQIVLASKLTNSTVTGNISYEPRNFTLTYSTGGYAYSNVAISNNITYGASISASSPAGLSFSGNSSR